MTVEALIEILTKANPTDEVKAYNADSQQLESITGMLFDGQDGIVELCTDDPD